MGGKAITTAAIATITTTIAYYLPLLVHSLSLLHLFLTACIYRLLSLSICLVSFVALDSAFSALEAVLDSIGLGWVGRIGLDWVVGTG